jgi:hypothetical protein
MPAGPNARRPEGLTSSGPNGWRTLGWSVHNPYERDAR